MKNSEISVKIFTKKGSKSDNNLSKILKKKCQKICDNRQKIVEKTIKVG